MKKYVICLVGIALILVVFNIFRELYHCKKNYECVGKLFNEGVVLNKEQRLSIELNIWPYTKSKNKGFGNIDYIENSFIKSNRFLGIELWKSIKHIKIYDSFNYEKNDFSNYLGLLKINSGILSVYFDNYKFVGVCKKNPI